MLSSVTPNRIQALRYALGESTATFGKRFERSGRTVEDWEQAHRQPPDKFILKQLEALERRVMKRRRPKDA